MTRFFQRGSFGAADANIAMKTATPATIPAGIAKGGATNMTARQTRPTIPQINSIMSLEMGTVGQIVKGAR